MPKGKKPRAEEVTPKLREAEVLVSQGESQAVTAKAIGVST